MRRRPLAPVLVSALLTVARADAAPVLHERIPPDPREDVALAASVDGELPAAIDTPSGLVTAPDPHRPPTANDGRGGGQGLATAPPNATFQPDRDTHRPDVLPYDDPFTPSTAPFKRLMAFDAVDANYTLSVRDPRIVPLVPKAQPAADGSDEQFYADLVVDLMPGRRVRIPSVGPGARIVRARLGVGATDIAARYFRDGAENWFVEAETATRARLVMELTIPRGAFGGDFGDPAWSDLPRVAPLPAGVARAANEVAARIGVSRALSPRQDVQKLVAYYRSFVDSDDPPPASGDIYLDLALSKKGVCRHRAFAFLVTALGLGIPTRMIANEAHAWVEVNDGSLWRRIDLGGAGRALREAQAQAPVRHDAPADPFAWPPNASRGEDLAETARAGASNGSSGGGAPARATTSAGGAAGSSGGDDSSNGAGGPTNEGMSASKDDRPRSSVSVALVDADAHRGAPLRVRGEVTADGEACPHVLVDVLLHDGKGHDVAIGAVATDARGAYEGSLVVPETAPLGDYEIVARTPGDARCGRGGSR